MIVVNAAERNKLCKVVEATANMDWVFVTDRQVELVLDPDYIRQLFNSRGVAVGDRLRIVAMDGDARCFCNVIVIGYDKLTGYTFFADENAPGRPSHGVTVRRGPTPEEMTVTSGPAVNRQQFVTGNADVRWNVGRNAYDVVVEGHVVCWFPKDQKDMAIRVAGGHEPIPQEKEVA